VGADEVTVDRFLTAHGPLVVLSLRRDADRREHRRKAGSDPFTTFGPRIIIRPLIGARKDAFSKQRDAKMQDRRHFLKTGFSIAVAGLAGAAALVRARGSLAEEAPPETTSVRGRTLALRRLTSSTISYATRGSPTSATYLAQIRTAGPIGSRAETRTSPRTMPPP
jgi:hypothetical protein